MRRVPIRQLSGALIQSAAEAGETLAITNDQVVCALVRPIDQHAVDEFIGRNLSRVGRSIDLAESAVARQEPLPVLLRSSEADEPFGNHRVDVDTTVSSGGPVRRMSIRQLSGTVLEEAARSGEQIALTNGRRLCAMIDPISVEWVNALVEENLSRLTVVAQRGEKDVELGSRS